MTLDRATWEHLRALSSAQLTAAHDLSSAISALEPPPPGEPPAPTDVAVAVNDLKEVWLNWSEVPNCTYKVYGHPDSPVPVVWDWHVMRELPTGEYTFFVTAVDKTTLVESEPSTTVVAVVGTEPPPPPPPPPPGYELIPALDWDPVDPATLTQVITGGYDLAPGEVLENADISGILSFPPEGATVRNVRVTTGTTSHGVVQRQRDGEVPGPVSIDGLTVRLTNTDKGANSGIAVRRGTVKNFRVEGYGDGFKMWHDTTYDTFVLVISKVPGSTKHADGIQNSGKSNCIARNGRVENGAATGFNGGHAAAFVQAFNGSSDVPTANVLFDNIALNGGQFLIATGEGKTSTEPLLSNIRFQNIYCGRDFYQEQGRPFNIDGDVVLENVVWEDTLEPVVV